MEPLSFTVEMESSAGGGIKIPFDVREIFGRAKPPVLVTINDFTYRSTVAVYGGEYYIPLKKANAEAAGVVGGEPVAVHIAEDTEPRVVEVPDDLAAALDEAGVRDRWDALSYSHQRAHVDAIEQARRQETRVRRVAKAVEMVAEG